MPRPRKCRRIRGDFSVYYYKPKGVRLSELEQVNLELDEIEGIRLVDLEGLPMEEAAESMKISKPTLCRMVNSGRKKLADAICSGKAISIHNYLTNSNMPNFDGTGPEGKGAKTGRQMGKCDGANNSLQELNRKVGGAGQRMRRVERGRR
ncbi:DUF134 domain-containing protein [Patescibacteria group bacterium]|nr:DUF134 domain-containing protein [Patescibacteria group bacterium]